MLIFGLIMKECFADYISLFIMGNIFVIVIILLLGIALKHTKYPKHREEGLIISTISIIKALSCTFEGLQSIPSVISHSKRKHDYQFITVTSYAISGIMFICVGIFIQKPMSISCADIFQWLMLGFPHLYPIVAFMLVILLISSILLNMNPALRTIERDSVDKISEHIQKWVYRKLLRILVCCILLYLTVSLKVRAWKLFYTLCCISCPAQMMLTAIYDSVFVRYRGKLDKIGDVILMTAGISYLIILFV